MAWHLWMYNKQPFRESTTLSCSVSWLVSEIVFFFIIITFFFTNTWAVLGNWSTISTGRAGMDIPLCFIFFYFLTMEACGLNVTGLWHHRQLPRPMRAKPHLPDARFMPIRTASICVYACVYIDIYIKREKYLWIYFFFLFCDESY